MAASKIKTDINPNAGVSNVPSDWEWETVAREAGTKVVFDTIGDVLVGLYEGMQTVAPEGTDKDGKNREPFDVYLFTGQDGELYTVNSSYSIVQAMGQVDTGKWVRLTYVKDVEVAGRPEPMKSFRVDVRK